MFTFYLQICLQICYKMFTEMLQIVHKFVTKMLQNVHNLFTKMLHFVYKMFTIKTQPLVDDCIAREEFRLNVASRKICNQMEN